MSSSPCRRSHPAGASRRVSRVRRAVLPSPLNREARPPGLWYFGATCAFTSVTARGLTHHPSDGSVGFRVSVSLHPATQVTGLWLLPRRDWLPLDTSAFSGRTIDHQLERRELPERLIHKAPYARLPRRLRLDSKRRKREADSDDDSEPDQPHGAPRLRTAAGESSRTPRRAPAQRRTSTSSRRRPPCHHSSTLKAGTGRRVRPQRLARLIGTRDCGEWLANVFSRAQDAPFVSRIRSATSLDAARGPRLMWHSKFRPNRSPPGAWSPPPGPSTDPTSGRSKNSERGPHGHVPAEAHSEVVAARPFESRPCRERDAVGRTRARATPGLGPAQARRSSPRVGLRSAPLRPASDPGRQDAQHAELRLQQTPAPQGRRRGAAGELHHRA